MSVGTIPILDWHAEGDDRLVAWIDGDDDYLVIDHDDERPGDCKWYLTWFHADEHPSGLVLQGDHDADGLKAYARTWVGDDE
jgi:hypothetical protein